jgi:two-component system alkaline phosphatase synthesis response regulator PhoP
MALIYAVEDDVHINQLIHFSLQSSGYEVETFTNAQDLYAAVEKQVPDLFILDVMLPDEDGFTILKKIRRTEKNKDTPIIILTAKTEESDKVFGLNSGADDYIGKPFGVMELIARVGALLRRTAAQNDVLEEEVLSFKDLVVDIRRHTVNRVQEGTEDESIALTNKEFDLLAYLIKQNGVVLTRDVLLDKIWGYDYMGETRTVDVHMKSLRKKIGDDSSNPEYIQTVRGLGYKLADV